MYSFAMLGMVEGNGHPYSWSAIFNGYDAEMMAQCPYPVIPQYLSEVPVENLRIPNAQVTHIWTDNPKDAVNVAQASLIPHILSRPEEAIGQVDAVIISTDIGSEHLERAKPFLKAGIPVFIDKPLTDNIQDLREFRKLVQGGAPLLSSSCMRYAKEFEPYHCGRNFSGKISYLSCTTPKSWERYGIHALESIYPIIGPDFLSVQNIGDLEHNVVHIRHKAGADISIAAIKDIYGGFGAVQIIGPEECVQLKFQDTYYAFRKQLEAFVSYLDTGEPPFSFRETEELVKIIVAGIISREEGGRKVSLDEVDV